jgi:hypothetical protein
MSADQDRIAQASMAQPRVLSVDPGVQVEQESVVVKHCGNDVYVHRPHDGLEMVEPGVVANFHCPGTGPVAEPGPLARAGDVIEHGQPIPANVVRLSEAIPVEDRSWRRVEPGRFEYYDRRQDRVVVGPVNLRMPEWAEFYPMAVVEVDPEPQPAEPDEPVHYYFTELRTYATSCGLGIDDDVHATDEAGKATCETCRIAVDEEPPGVPQPSLGVAWLREAIQRWMPDQWREQAVAVLLELDKPTESGPVVLSLPEQPSWAQRATTPDATGDSVIEWVRDGSRWDRADHSLRGLFWHELLANGPVTLAPREPRTWPKLDGPPGDLRAVEVEGHGVFRRHPNTDGWAKDGSDGLWFWREVLELGGVREVLP